jgi:hypothetical protein
MVNAPGKCKLKRIACQAGRIQLMAANFQYVVSSRDEITNLHLVYALEDASRRRSARNDAESPKPRCRGSQRNFVLVVSRGRAIHGLHVAGWRERTQRRAESQREAKRQLIRRPINTATTFPFLQSPSTHSPPTPRVVNESYVPLTPPASPS